MTSDLDRRLEAQHHLSPASADLARPLALAVSIEPALLRAMHRLWLPAAGAEAESALWLGPLVETRTPTLITLHPGLRDRFLDELAALHANPQSRSRVDAARALVTRAHQGLSPALQLEEELVWCGIRGDEEAMSAAVDQVLAAYAGGQRNGLEQWAARAWSRLPLRVRNAAAGAALFEMARKSALPVRLTRGPEATPARAESLALIAARLPQTQLGVARHGATLQIGEVESGYSIAVPNTAPILVQLQTDDSGDGEWLHIAAGERLIREVGPAALRLRSTSGELYELPALPLHLVARQFSDRLQVQLLFADWREEANQPLPPSLQRIAQKLFEDGANGELGTPLAEILLPPSIRSRLSPPTPLLLDLDADTAVWPWESLTLTGQALGATRIISRLPLPPGPPRTPTAGKTIMLAVEPTTDRNGSARLASEELAEALKLHGFDAHVLGEGLPLRQELSLLRLLGIASTARLVPPRGESGRPAIHLLGTEGFVTLDDVLAGGAPDCVLLDLRLEPMNVPTSSTETTAAPDFAQAARLAHDVATALVAGGARCVVLKIRGNEEDAEWLSASGLHEALAAGMPIGEAVRQLRAGSLPRAHSGLKVKKGREPMSRAHWCQTLLFGDPQWTLSDPATTHLGSEAIEPKGDLLIAARIDGNVLNEFGAGLFRIQPGTELDLQRTAIGEMNADAPILLLIHSLASNIRGSFGDLWQGTAAESWSALRAKYGPNALAYQYASLGRSPLESALFLARALPSGARLHLLTLSEGGLLGELLCRSQRIGGQAPFDADDRALFEGDSTAMESIDELSRVLQAKRLRIERFVRVACPARGSQLLDWLPTIGKVASRLLPWPLEAAMRFAGSLVEPAHMPGFAAVIPDAPLIRMLNRLDVSVESDLSALVGVATPSGGLLKRLSGMLLSRLSGGESDLVVDTHSALAGTHRFGLAWTARVEGPDVDHFHYFTNADSTSLALARLASGTAVGWQRLREGAGQPPASTRAVKQPGDNSAASTTSPAILGRGARGKDVTQLQTALKHHGAQLEVDGLFGPSTEMAVRQFQRAHGLTADGTAGPQTLSVLLGDTAA